MNVTNCPIHFQGYINEDLDWLTTDLQNSCLAVTNASWKILFWNNNILFRNNPISTIWLKESHLFALFNSTRFLRPYSYLPCPSADCWWAVVGRDCPCSAAGTYVTFIINHKQNVLQQQSVSMLP
jgi:hypothetical protein